MKNLKVVTRIAQKLQLQLDGETVVVSAVDAERRRAFFVSSENFLYSVDLPAPTQVRFLCSPICYTA
jgi:elongator complex protein 1